MINLATCKSGQLAQKVFGSKIRRPEEVLVTIAGVCKNDANGTDMTAKTL